MKLKDDIFDNIIDKPLASVLRKSGEKRYNLPVSEMSDHITINSTDIKKEDSKKI